MALFDFLRRKPKSLMDVLNENEGFRKAQSAFQALDALAEQGLDVDELPDGVGEFGLDADNPIPCRSIAGSHRYLTSLLSYDGTKISWERKASRKSAASLQPVDIYRISESSAFENDLFISPYP